MPLIRLRLVRLGRVVRTYAKRVKMRVMGKWPWNDRTKIIKISCGSRENRLLLNGFRRLCRSSIWTCKPYSRPRKKERAYLSIISSSFRHRYPQIQRWRKHDDASLDRSIVEHVCPANADRLLFDRYTMRRELGTTNGTNYRCGIYAFRVQTQIPDDG